MLDIHSLYSFSFPTNIRFGAGAAGELGNHLKDNELSKPLIVTDPVIANLGFFENILEDLNASDIHPVLFYDIHKNPVKSDVLKGGEVYHQSGCDSIVGIGGGAGLDVSRAIALRVNHTRDLFDYDDLEGGEKYITGDIPYFITIPTTAGTGSEVGRAAIISDDETRKKRILFSPKLLARQVFADPELTYALPPGVTAATGMDALTHNIEAYLVNTFHPMADGIAMEGMRLVYHSIARAVNDPDPESRANMLMGSMMGAVAFQKGLGIVHAMSHPLSTMFDMHHGLANAINLPVALKHNIPGNEKKFAEIARIFGLPGKDPGNEVLNALAELNQNIGIPENLATQGVEEKHIDALTELAFNDFALPANPNKATKEDIRALYMAVLK